MRPPVIVAIVLGVLAAALLVMLLIGGVLGDQSEGRGNTSNAPAFLALMP